MSDNLNHLREIAEAFRETLEEVGPTSSDIEFLDFPKGACRGTSDLLARYLIEEIEIDRKRVQTIGAERSGHTSHVWVIVDGIIIDITADQEPHKQEPVIVEVRSAWHDDWPEKQHRPFCYPAKGDLYPYATWDAALEEMRKRGFPKSGAPC